jgi:hypothetical protein
MPLPSGVAHQKRFAKWQNLCPPKTRALSAAIDRELLAMLAERGFIRVDTQRQFEDCPVSGSEIELGREGGKHYDVVRFNFEKYRTPRVQVSGSRHEAHAPYKCIRACNLVARDSQYYHFWGRSWWLPDSLWPDARVQATVNAIRKNLDQLLHFLETGERGPNISKSLAT